MSQLKSKSRFRGGLGIMVITQDCGSCNTGSIPVGHPKGDLKNPRLCGFFSFFML